MTNSAQAQARYRHARQLLRAGAGRAAVREFRHCLRLRPRHPAAWLGLGHGLKALGHPGAAAAYKRCLTLRPGSGAAWFSLANLKTYHFEPDDISRMRALLAADPGEPATAVYLHFALAGALEQGGEYPAAWQNYEAGNRAWRRRVRYDPASIRTRVDQLLATRADPGAVARIQADERAVRPVFVVGMPRSGSTLLEQMLASHSRVTGCGELPHAEALGRELAGRAGAASPEQAMAGLSAGELEALGARYLALAQPRPDALTDYFVDKTPGNFTRLAFLQRILPTARVIHIQRDPMDCCVANLRQYYPGGNLFSYDQRELALHYGQYRRLMRHWQTVLPGLIHRVQYEELVREPERVMRDLLEFLGLPWEPGCLDFHLSCREVHTASAGQVRSALYRSGVGAWRRYQPWLGELQAALQSPAGSQTPT